MNNMPLNPYERYELMGVSDEERDAERFEAEQRRWEDYTDYESEALIDDLEAILDV